MVATLVTGLRADSRLKMKMTGTKVPTDTTILAMIFDACSTLIWMNSEDGRKNRNRPKSLVKALTEEPDTKTVSFSSGDAFERARAMALEKVRKGGKHA